MAAARGRARSRGGAGAQEGGSPSLTRRRVSGRWKSAGSKGRVMWVRVSKVRGRTWSRKARQAAEWQATTGERRLAAASATEVARAARWRSWVMAKSLTSRAVALRAAWRASMRGGSAASASRRRRAEGAAQGPGPCGQAGAAARCVAARARRREAAPGTRQKMVKNLRKLWAETRCRRPRGARAGKFRRSAARREPRRAAAWKASSEASSQASQRRKESRARATGPPRAEPRAATAAATARHLARWAWSLALRPRRERRGRRRS
mmetsp:Transcript_1189/g.3558  ORF Transcript_1189/g.3558 Transcript_1189/m.3558 type:complete len:265 (+) Transcript_1189:341-1135(+)